MNKKEVKFKFVSMEDTVDINNVEIVNPPKEVSIDKTIEEVPKEDNTIVEETKIKNINNDKKNTKNNHLGYGKSLFIMIFVIILLLCGTCVLMYEVIHYSKSDSVTFDEVSKVNYEVCPIGEDYECIEENQIYKSSNIKSINVTFDYNIDFSKNTNYDLNYYIVAITNIYDKLDNSKNLYRHEDILVDRTTISDTKSNLNIYKDVTYDYYKDNRYVADYKNLYDKEYVGNVEIILYLIDNDEDRKVSSITVPLNSNSFSIEKYNISNTNKDENVIDNGWSKYSMMCAIIASLLVFISLILIYRVTHLILKVNNSRSSYQQRLNQILRDYDRIIVIARDGYESNIERKQVELNSFDELLDVKDRLSKPIIFSKINDVMGEFIVEDDETLYRYVLKD